MKWLLTVVAQLLFAIFMYVMGSVFFGAALVPGLALLLKVWHATVAMIPLVRLFFLGTAVSLGYFIFGLTLILLVGLFRTMLGLRLKEGTYPLFSGEALKWAFISSLFLLIHYTFIDFILLTPFANIMFRLLGAKLGKNVQFNSKYVFDATLLEIGDNTVIGGGAIINCHIVERASLKLRKVKIGSNVLLGSHCTVMPGCEIQDKAIIAAGAIVPKGTLVPARTVYTGREHEIKKDHREG
ncbi:MAG: DapH/DapD/GlmU-related protein [Candidatus Omnitrophota bacterium]